MRITEFAEHEQINEIGAVPLWKRGLYKLGATFGHQKSLGKLDVANHANALYKEVNQWLGATGQSKISPDEMVNSLRLRSGKFDATIMAKALAKIGINGNTPLSKRQLGKVLVAYLQQSHYNTGATGIGGADADDGASSPSPTPRPSPSPTRHPGDSGTVGSGGGSSGGGGGGAGGNTGNINAHGGGGAADVDNEININIRRRKEVAAAQQRARTTTRRKPQKGGVRPQGGGRKPGELSTTDSAKRRREQRAQRAILGTPPPPKKPRKTKVSVQGDNDVNATGGTGTASVTESVLKDFISSLNKIC